MEEDYSIRIYDDKDIRTKWDKEMEDYYYSVVDVIAVLTDSKNPSAYWRKLKQGFNKEQIEVVTNCHMLKMPSNDGKMSLTDVTTTNNIISIIDNIKSDKKDDFIDWLNQRRLQQLYDVNGIEYSFLCHQDECILFVESIIDRVNDTLWATQKAIAQLFDVSSQSISSNFKEIIETGQLEKKSVVSQIKMTDSDGKKHMITFYNMDAITTLGYRIKSDKAILFRKWATNRLKEYIVKGFILDDELLKYGAIFDKDYFDYLLEVIREIQFSKRRFDQKITDLYATCYDYDKNSEITRKFYATVQTKLLYAVTRKTPAEILSSKNDTQESNIELTNRINSDEENLLSYYIITNNYLDGEEGLILDVLVNDLLILAEKNAKNHILTSMADWAYFLDLFILSNKLPLLGSKEKVSSEEAKILLREKLDSYNIMLDKPLEYDVDQLIGEVRCL